jgi:hypothetical protein
MKIATKIRPMMGWAPTVLLLALWLVRAPGVEASAALRNSFQEAVQLVRQGQLLEALKILDELVDTLPLREDLRVARAVVEAKAGLYDRARTDLSKIPKSSARAAKVKSLRAKIDTLDVWNLETDNLRTQVQGTPAQGREILAKVITAYGGEKLLSTLVGNSVIGTFTFCTEPGAPSAPFEGKSMPGGKKHSQCTRTFNGVEHRIENIRDGTRGWSLDNGRVAPMSAERFKESQESDYYDECRAWVNLKDPAWTVLPLKIAWLNGRRVVGLRISRGNAPKLYNYFDATTYLLVKSAHQSTHDGRPVVAMIDYDNYRACDGIQSEGMQRLYHGNELRATLEFSETHFVTSFPEDTFKGE